MLFEQRDRGHDEARRAEAAHERVHVAEGLLHGMQRVAGGETVDGTNLFALHLDRERRARVNGAAVDDHRAGAARPAVAHALVAGHVGAIADGVEQRHARLDSQIEPFAVHHQLDRHLARPDRAGSGGGLRLRVRDAGDTGREAADARGLQEVASRDAEARRLFRMVGMIVFWSHGLLAPST